MKMRLKTIEEEWTAFAAMIFQGQRPSPIQVQEMRKSFFAGAWMMLHAVQAIATPDISEDEGTAWLEERQAEGLAFYNNLIKSQAEQIIRQNPENN